MGKVYKYGLLVGAAFVVLLGLFITSGNGANKNGQGTTQITQTEKQAQTITYKGKTGQDALTMLKQQVNVEQDSSGMVSVINGRKADPARHQYWAFYVNGKLASVGAADYKTKNEDVIEWKISTY